MARPKWAKLPKKSSSSPCNYWESRYHSLEFKQIDTNTEEVSMDTVFPEVFELTVSEKLQLLEDLWDSIALNPEQIPVLDWQKDELAKRKAAHLQNPDAGSSWEAAKERIRQG
jgi:putative addiction module component (TIGR02574 family)